MAFNLDWLFGGKEEIPQAPEFTLPNWMQTLAPQTLGYIQQGIGQRLPEPAEYGRTSQALQDLLRYQPSTEAFQLPIPEIQQALAAQQKLQLQDYLNQIRPTLATQGQLDSTYYTNLLGKYLQGQQAQTYGTTADLLTQQALQNLAKQQTMTQWLPQFRAGIAGQLGSLGGQRSQIGQFNLMSPYQTYIPALQSMYGQGLQTAQQQYQPSLLNYQQQLNQYNQQQQQQQALMQSLGSLAMSAGMGALGGATGLYPGLSGFSGAGTGALYGLSGYSPAMGQLTQRFPWQKQKGIQGGYGGSLN